ncbi:hypothetical protein ANN_18718 [Periplaneta americana]|uniref:Uncharacterized protein n=1 Tax=Periplaneta americana TaxID=6978 RepID=A0ABQ8SPJ1_PERAM|nr:hypothetical protein ANN_18718 [Periplaneta americana]
MQRWKGFQPNKCLKTSLRNRLTTMANAVLTVRAGLQTSQQVLSRLRISDRRLAKIVQHCHLFPRALGEIIARYNVQELHISLTEGLWRHETWGILFMMLLQELNFWTWFKEGTEKKGLSTLLNAGYIHNTNYHSSDSYAPNMQEYKLLPDVNGARQTVSLVYDMVILGTGNQDWSIKKLFGIGLSGACPLATMSNTGASFQLNPIPPAVITSIRGGYESKFAVYDIKALDIEGMFNIAAFYSSPRVYGVNLPPVLHANRYIVVLKRYIPGKAQPVPLFGSCAGLPPRSMTEISIDLIMYSQVAGIS